MFSPLLRSRIAIGLAASALLVTGCASSDDSPSNKPKAEAKTADQLVTGLINTDDAGTPAKGGVITVAEYSEARSMDPTVTYSNGAAGGSSLLAIYDSLMAYDWEKHEFVPRMAESLDTDDHLTWTLKLRPDVKFSDGTPLDADAVVNSINFYNSKFAYGSLQWLSNVSGMKKVDDTTVEFTTRVAWATFPNLLAHGPGLVMAPAAYKDPANFKPIGAGPFLFDSYKPAEALELKANPDYWNGAPNLDGLKFVWPGGDPLKYDNLKSGDVDAAFIRDDVETSKLVKEDAAGMRWILGSGANIWINQREGRDGAMQEVREALQLAWDPVAYQKRIGEDSSIATKSLFGKSSPWYTGNEGTPADPEAAKAKLEEAKAKGFDGKLTYTHFGDAASTKAAVAVQAMLQAAGFEVDLKPLTNIADQIKIIYGTHDYDLITSAFSIPEEDPYLRLAGTTGAKSPTNATGYNDPEMDKLVTELASKANATEGLATMKKIEDLWQVAPPSLNVGIGISFMTWNDKTHGIVPTTETMVFYDKAWKK